MDTETIIRDLMKIQRLPLAKVTQQKQYLEWQLDSYRAVNRKLNDFSNNTFNNMILSGSFSAKKMEISAPNDVAISNKNSTSDFSGTIKIDKLAKNSTMQSTPIAGAVGKPGTTTLADLNITGTEIKISAIDKDGIMQDAKVTIASTDTLKNVMDKITKQTGVNAFYDAKTGQIAMTTKHGGTMGSGNPEIVVTSNGNLASGLGLAGQPVSHGQNAEFSINGLAMTRSTNTFEVNGFEFTLKAENPNEISFSSKPDTDAVFDSIVKFVDEYNKLIEDLNNQVKEPKHRSFQPLSAEEKADMSEKEIELWEEKAKSGTLRNDPMISSMITKMRTALMGTVEGLGSLKDIGIGSPSGKYAWQDNGKLVINEKDLKAAINADPNKVHELFSKSGTSTKVGEIADDQGFAVRLRSIATFSIAAIKGRAGEASSSTNASFTLGRSLDVMDKQMERFANRLKMVESRYWKQFNAMENAIQRANAQSANLMNSLGGGA